MTDITERRLAEIKISNNEKLLSPIYQNINEAIYISNDVPKLISVNDAYLKMFGFQSMEEVLAIDPRELYENDEDRRKYINKMEKEGSCSNIEVVFR